VLLLLLLAAGLQTLAAAHKAWSLLAAAAVPAAPAAVHTYETVPNLQASAPLHCYCTVAVLLLLLLARLLLLLLQQYLEEYRCHCCCCRWS
jgi:hypothetical protein